MTQLFTASEYAHLHSLVFRDGYPGYTPNIVESPNGDEKLDMEKRYAHVADKYLRYGTDEAKRYKVQWERNNSSYPHYDSELYLNQYLDRAHNLAIEVATAIGIPRPFWPSRKYSALRVLEYGPTAVTHTHTDFCLFTLMCYRNLPKYFKYCEPEADTERFAWLSGRSPAQAEKHLMSHIRAQELNSQIHFGELLEEIDSVSYKADDHRVVASNGPWQYSIVHFCVPDHDAVLPSGITVGKWMDERKKRSRYER